MTRSAKTNPVDVCVLHVKPKHATDPSIVSRKFSSVIALPEFERSRDLIMDIFTSVGYAKSDCPEVWIQHDGIKLLWSEADRFLHIYVTYERVVSYYVAKAKAEVPNWQPISNLAIVEEVVFKLGRYITGASETDCGERRMKL